MKITETYQKNIKALEKILDTFSFSDESKEKIKTFINNPLDVLNDDIKALFRKYDNRVVDYRILLPNSMIQQKQDYSIEYYVIMGILMDCLALDDSIKFKVDDEGEITPKIMISEDAIGASYFKIGNDKRKLWRYLDSKAKALAENIISNRETSLDGTDIFGILKGFESMIVNYFRSLGSKKTMLKEKINTVLSTNFRVISCSSETDKKSLVDEITSKIKLLFNIAQEIMSAKVIDCNKFQAYLSFNAFDWLLASSGEKWHSCIDLQSSMCYGVGLLGMCGCPDWGMMLYTDGSTKNVAGIEAYHIITRSWVCYTNNKRFKLINWYPKDIRSATRISDIDDIRIETEDDSESFSSWKPITYYNNGVAWIYSDINEFIIDRNGKTVHFSLNDNERFCGIPKLHYAEDTERFEYGGDEQSDLIDAASRAGGIYSALIKGISLKDTVRNRETCRCGRCGEFIEGDEESSLTYIESEDRYVCRSCLDNYYFWCERCEEYHDTDDAYELYFGIEDYEYNLVCRSCIDYISENGEIWCDEYTGRLYEGNVPKVTITNENGDNEYYTERSIATLIERNEIKQNEDGTYSFVN